MKLTYPTREEVGAWLTGLTVCCAGVLAGKQDFSRWWLPGLAVWGFCAAVILIFLTIRATVRKRRDVAEE